MKYFFLFFGVILGGHSICAPIDSLLLRGIYRYRCITDTVRMSDAAEGNWMRHDIGCDTMYLDIDRRISRFYSVRYARYDSLRQMHRLDKFAPDNPAALSGHPTPAGESFVIYKHFPEPDRLTFTDEIFGIRFLYEEPCEPQSWTLSPDSITIAGYPCRKAECNFRGRKWVAWYCSDLPAFDGPWKLHGLPGLILKAEDAAGHYCFELIGLQPSMQAIALPNEKFERTNRKHYLRHKRKSLMEPLETFNASQQRITISIENNSDFKDKLTSSPVLYDLLERK